MADLSPGIEPGPDRILAILLGAGWYAQSPKLAQGPSFENSARDMREYLTRPDGMGIPRTNVNWLFDDGRSAVDQLRDVEDWLEGRVEQLKAAGTKVTDLILYYCGHGMFCGPKRAYHLAIRATKESSESLTSISVSELARALNEHARFLRKFLVLDCCFAGAAYSEFQAGPLQVSRAQLVNDLPARGTALLCAASAKEAAIAPQGLPRTMFSDSLLKALDSGHPSLGPQLSLSELGALVRQNLKESFPQNWVRPEIHCPDQREGEVADVALFPNPGPARLAALREEQRKARELEEVRRKEEEGRRREMEGRKAEEEARQAEQQRQVEQQRREAEEQLARQQADVERKARELEEARRKAETDQKKVLDERKKTEESLRAEEARIARKREELERIQRDAREREIANTRKAEEERQAELARLQLAAREAEQKRSTEEDAARKAQEQVRAAARLEAERRKAEARKAEAEEDRREKEDALESEELARIQKAAQEREAVSILNGKLIWLVPSWLPARLYDGLRMRLRRGRHKEQPAVEKKRGAEEEASRRKAPGLFVVLAARFFRIAFRTATLLLATLGAVSIIIIVLLVFQARQYNLNHAHDAPTSSEPAESALPAEHSSARSVGGSPVSRGVQETSAKTFKDCDVCPEMVHIPAGQFMMGSPENEPGRFDNEGPQHRVQVSAFLIGKYDVTFDEWDACVADGRCTTRPSDSWGRGRRPVEGVSWEDAQQYVRWLSHKTGKHYRLPSEAEWEYAARAGTTTVYYWGSAVGRGHANCNGCGSPWGGKTAPVGSFDPNPWGLYDMAGNVDQWVQDCYHDDYIGAPLDGSARTTGCYARHRVVRGGYWGSDARKVRAANRNGVNGPSQYGGFRVARTPGAQPASAQSGSVVSLSRHPPSPALDWGGTALAPGYR